MTINDSKQQYAPGVTIASECSEEIWYFGKEPALIGSKLIERGWLPGKPGNGKTSQSLVFMEDGSAKLLPAKSRIESFDMGFGGMRIMKSGALFHIKKYWTKEERERRQVDRRSQQDQETWRLAKQVHQQPDLPERWKNGVLYHVDQAEKLIEGKLVFTDFPDIEIPPCDVEAAKRAIAELRNVLRWITPKVKNKVQKGNVFSMNEAAFRGMKKG